MRKLGWIEKSVVLIALLSFGLLGRELTITLSTKSPSPLSDVGNSVTIHRRQRIAYQLYPYNVTTVVPNFNDPYQCRDYKKRHMRRRFEPNEIYETPGVLDFRTRIETDLNILFMGDSVGIQFSQAFEGAAGGYDRKVFRETASYELEEYEVHCEGLHSSPTNDGGWIAGWRITGMLRREGEDKPLPNEPGGGWVREDITVLADHMRAYRDADSITRVDFDTVVFRIPQGWITSEDVNNETLQETVELAYKLFGARSVIYVNLPLCNNYKNVSDVERMKLANRRIELFARDYKPENGTDSVQHVMALDFGRLTWMLISWNAKLLGMTRPLDIVYARKVGTFDLNDPFPPSEVHVCSRRMNPKSRFGECLRNHLSYDGMHWCMETIGGRVNAGLACLLSCAHNGEVDYTIERHLQVQECATRCNNLFMRIDSVGIEQ